MILSCNCPAKLPPPAPSIHKDWLHEHCKREMPNVQSIVSEEILKLILAMRVDTLITSILTSLEEGSLPLEIIIISPGWCGSVD